MIEDYVIFAESIQIVPTQVTSVRLILDDVYLTHIFLLHYTISPANNLVSKYI